MDNTKLIAITGGIGSGKSVALSVLGESGCSILSSDNIVSELYEKKEVKKLLKKMFPKAVKGIFNLSVDKKKIADEAFNDKRKHAELTNAITPLVMDEILERSKTLSSPVFAEVPLLFECGFQNQFDGVIVITRSVDHRIESVKKRSRLSSDEILSRMRRQIDYDSLDLSPYVVINNDGDIERFISSVLDVAEKFKD